MQVIHDKAKTEYVEKVFNGQYKIKIPTFQRYPELVYEPQRTASMEKHLKQGDVLFDVGVSDGWLSAIYAQFVGAENMCLFEPSAAVWPNIKAIWEANELKNPLAAFYGFVSDTTQLEPPRPMENLGYDYERWPLVAHNANLIEEMTFRSVLSTGNNIPQITIDDFADRTSIQPDALSIDVEGAEFLVLKGAENTLAKYHPFIWLSLHDINGALTYDYHTTKDEVFTWLKDRDYSITWLENYGDSHWLCK